jgi:hypothetical protein
MKKHRFMMIMSIALAAAVFGLSSGDVLAEKKADKNAPKQAVTLDDQAKKFGKMTPSEQKAAAKRNRDLGLLPGVAGKTAQAPAPGAAR